MKKVFITLILIVSISFSCNDSITEDLGPSYDRSNLLNNWYDFNIIPAHKTFKRELDQFKSKTNSFKENPSASTLDDLRTQFLDTYLAWQGVEIFNFGKAEEIYYNSKVNIYPVNSARVNSNISSGQYDLSNANNFAAQGLPTIDYLLYGIAPESDILNKISSNDHLTYLINITDEMIANTEDVMRYWETNKLEFVNSIDNTSTSSMNMMVNDFIYYYEKGFRANKFGIPAGVFSSTPIPENIECYYSKINSKKLAMESLIRIIEFYEGLEYGTGYPYPGNSGASLKKIIIELDQASGENNLGNRISDKINTAKQMLSELDENFYNQINNNNTKFLRVYDAIQEVVVLLKVDMLQLLSINVDYVDADGD
tara:strand:- start:1494 stop:2600 length:1107 start_codon:yes stop_codon:yes gene_type:complete